MVRAFISVDISRAAREALARIVKGLQDNGPLDVRWVKPESIHLTLKFLGDVEPLRLKTVSEAMKRASRGTGAMNLALAGAGAFPNLTGPRVLWVGLKGDIEPLVGLQGRIDQELYESVGFPKEDRPFTPHLTLGRMRDHVPLEERRKVGKAIAELGLETEVWWQVEEVYLMRSTLTPAGAVYDALGSWPL